MTFHCVREPTHQVFQSVEQPKLVDTGTAPISVPGASVVPVHSRLFAAPPYSTFM